MSASIIFCRNVFSFFIRRGINFSYNDQLWQWNWTETWRVWKEGPEVKTENERVGFWAECNETGQCKVGKKMANCRGKQKEKQQWESIELAQICLGSSVWGNAGVGFPDR